MVACFCRMEKSIGFRTHYKTCIVLNAVREPFKNQESLSVSNRKEEGRVYCHVCQLWFSEERPGLYPWVWKGVNPTVLPQPITHNLAKF